jgi:SAM-dependent methyltransferase
VLAAPDREVVDAQHPDLASRRVRGGHDQSQQNLPARVPGQCFGWDGVSVQAFEIPATSFSEADAADLPFGPASFDLVLANHLLNDLHDVKVPVSEFARVLRTGGRFVALMLNLASTGTVPSEPQTAGRSQRPSISPSARSSRPSRVDGI